MNFDPAHIIARKVSLAKLSIYWERLLERLYPAMMIAGIVLLCMLSGVLNLLPVWLKLTAFGAAGAGFVYSLKNLGSLSWPTDEAALARIERKSGKMHRPASGWTDTLADETSAGPEQKALWQAHRRRMAKQLHDLKAGAPRSPLPRIDQNALRNALAIALIAAGVLSAGTWREKIAEAIAVTAPVPVNAIAMDAWLNPPSYTAKPPVLLTRRAQAASATSEVAVISVPQGSELVVRLNGADDLKVTLADPTSSAEAPAVFDTLEADGPRAGAAKQAVATPSATQELRTKIQKSAIVSVSGAGRELGMWTVNVIADLPPVVTVPEQIQITPSGAFSLPWKVTDDYGVTSLSGRVALRRDGLDADKIDVDSPFLSQAPEFAISMRKVNPRQAEGKSFQDLTAHPWAGLPVEVVIEGMDQAGQTGRSDVVKLALPERQFSKPLAQALVEQRKNIFFQPDNQRDVVRALSAILVWPKGVIEKSGVYLGIRHAAAKLYRARTHEESQQVADTLWEIALTIESGNLHDSLKKLQAIKKQLEKALAEGAPEEKIADLMKQLREAMNEYLQAMQQQMQENQRNNPQAQNQQQQNRAQQEVRSQDLQRMMDMIENLAKSGARDAAQQMLSELENILQNLQPGRRQANPQRTSPMAKMLDQLSEMMRRQQQLMDQTFQMPQNGQQRSGDQNQSQQQGEQGQEPGGRGQSQQQTPGNGQLSQQQGDLGKMLERLMEQMQQQGLQSPDGLGRAQQQMGEAAGELGQGQRDEALGSQGEAMRGLREGARNMAQQLMQQGTGNEGNVGRHGEGRGEQRDPLGRPLPSQGEEYGQRDNMVPQEAEVERARRILDALRSRANEAGRPKLELDYIDRLLKGLY
jgi:uncharacterized protein (TIGR02302 family)